MPERNPELPDGEQTAKNLDALYRSGKATDVLDVVPLSDLRVRPLYFETNKIILMDSFRNISPVGTVEQEAQRLLLVGRDLVSTYSSELMFTTEEKCIEIAARLKEITPATLADAARQTYNEELAKDERNSQWLKTVQDWSQMVDITEEAVRQWERDPAVFVPAI